MCVHKINVRTFVETFKTINMKAIQYKTVTGEVKTAFNLSHSFGKMYVAKSSEKKRDFDLFIHEENLISFSGFDKIEETVSNEISGYSKTDEFNGLVQAGELGLNFGKVTELVR